MYFGAKCSVGFSLFRWAFALISPPVRVLARVSLGDAGRLLKCVEQPEAQSNLQQLVSMIFEHRWCYRPKEMAPDWTNMQQWCVWGFAKPSVPPLCGA